MPPITILFDELEGVEDLCLEPGVPGVALRGSLCGPSFFEHFDGLFLLCGTLFQRAEPAEFDEIGRLCALECLKPRLDGPGLGLHFDESLTEEGDFELGGLRATRRSVDDGIESGEVWLASG